MKTLIILLTVCATAASVLAQQVNLMIQPINSKRGSGGDYSRDVQASRALKITIQNPTPNHINGLTLRWAVVKSKVGTTIDPYQKHAFGAEQQIDLKPLEQLVIETKTVSVARREYDYTNHKYGEVIDGHGAQVLKDGKIIAEQMTPPAIKKSFENIRPVEGDKK